MKAIHGYIWAFQASQTSKADKIGIELLKFMKMP
jgi:hypothetical protein